MEQASHHLAIVPELVNLFHRHKEAAFVAGDDSTLPRVLGVVVDPKHPRFLEIGEVVDQGWYGEGGLTLRYTDNQVVSLGGEVNRGGVKDSDIGEIRPDLLNSQQRKLLEAVCRDSGNLLKKE